MKDEQDAGPEWHDCSHYSREVNPFYYEHQPERQHLDVMYCTSAPLGAGYVVPISVLMDGFTITSGTPEEREIVRPSDYHRLYKRGFTLKELPVDVLIDRDPFDTNFSAWYLLVDLVDLRNAWESLQQRRGHRDLSVHKKMRYYLKGSNATAKDVANTNLGIQFGVLPTVKDMQDFFTVLANWQKVYGDMEEFTHKLRRHRFKPVDVKELKRDFTVMGQCVVPGVTLPMRARVTTESAVFHRTAQYLFTAPEFQGWVSRLKQFVDAFGILDPAAIWDVIPFSFVIDWFVNVGDWLHKNRPQLFPAGVSYEQYCESLKVRTIINWDAEYARIPDFTSPAYAPNWHVIGYSDITAYARRKFRPSPRTLQLPKVNKSFVSLRRISISASLVAQRIPR